MANKDGGLPDHPYGNLYDAAARLRQQQLLDSINAEQQLQAQMAQARAAQQAAAQQAAATSLFGLFLADPLGARPAFKPRDASLDDLEFEANVMLWLDGRPAVQKRPGIWRRNLPVVVP